MSALGMGYEQLPTVEMAHATARAFLRDLVTTRTPALTIRCTYCGAPCWGRVCRAHRDLLEIEAEATAPHREVSAAASDREEGTR